MGADRLTLLLFRQAGPGTSYVEIQAEALGVCSAHGSSDKPVCMFWPFGCHLMTIPLSEDF